MNKIADLTDTLVELGGGALPCADCGIVVAFPDPGMTVEVQRVRSGRATSVLMTKCGACFKRDQLAEELARRYLRRGLTFKGYRHTATEAVALLVEARTAFDAAGMDPSTVEGRASSPAALLVAEVAHLGSAVKGLRWRDRLNPPSTVLPEPIRLVRPGTANSRPWAHLDEDDRARLHPGIADVLQEQVALLAPPVALSPPDIHRSAGKDLVAAGCIYCGIGLVTVSALAVSRAGGTEALASLVWTACTVGPDKIGARRGVPGALAGWLCPACEKAAAEVGSANSARAMEYALSAVLGVPCHTIGGDELWIPGLKGWGGLVADARLSGRPEPPPNAEPWGHLSRASLDELARELRRGGA